MFWKIKRKHVLHIFNVFTIVTSPSFWPHLRYNVGADYHFPLYYHFDNLPINSHIPLWTFLFRRSDGLEVSGSVCHVGKPEERTHLLQQTLETYKKIDCLVMSAGINPYVGPFLKTPEGKWDSIFDVNVKVRCINTLYSQNRNRG